MTRNYYIAQKSDAIGSYLFLGNTDAGEVDTEKVNPVWNSDFQRVNGYTKPEAKNILAKVRRSIRGTGIKVGILKINPPKIVVRATAVNGAQDKTEETPVKRGPGRPKVVKPEVPANGDAPVKRGPGRPRKPVDPNAPVLPKKKRGRPPLKKVVEPVVPVIAPTTEPAPAPATNAE